MSWPKASPSEAASANPGLSYTKRSDELQINWGYQLKWTAHRDGHGREHAYGSPKAVTSVAAS